MTSLFDPITVGKHELANRIVMAPMTRARAGVGGTATRLMARYYTQRASAGLIVTEAIHPCAVGQGYLDTPGLHTPAQVQSWRQVTDSVHAAGGRIFAQLQHAGRVSHPDLLPPGMFPVAPSAIRAQVQSFTRAGRVDCPIPTELTLSDIAKTIREFADAAVAAVDAGFDGVELQCANGFLLAQFLNAAANQRTDHYGGRLRHRMRFPVEVVEAVADAIGPERAGLKVSPGNPYNGMDPSEDATDIPALVDALPLDLAYLHVAEKGDRWLTHVLRDTWPGVMVVNPGRTDALRAQEALDCGVADLVSFGALFVSNPDLPARLRAGGPYNAVVASDFYGGGERGYTDYQTLA
ncbi:alkene reductase [Allorhizocola rhizosphaerae]|uniref:alkene reductase n=1 Tax=Allorhizocola rhizosphaerae TaxID=1872709 RepID=UPI000E3EB8F0|nr:alkene reductase [Allorhizocola rhizosphaerae]